MIDVRQPWDCVKKYARDLPWKWMGRRNFLHGTPQKYQPTNNTPHKLEIREYGNLILDRDRRRGTLTGTMELIGCFISHADCADDADLPCGLRHWNVPVARMAQMGKMKRLKHERMKRLKAIRCSLLRWTNKRSRLRRKHLRNLRDLRAKKSERKLCVEQWVFYFSRRLRR